MEKYVISVESQQISNMETMETLIEAMPVKTGDKCGCFILTTNTIIEIELGSGVLNMQATIKHRDTKTIWVDNMDAIPSDKKIEEDGESIELYELVLK